MLKNLRRDKQLTSEQLVTIVPQEKILQPVKKHVHTSKSSGRKAVSTTKIVPSAITAIKTESKGVPACNKTKETKKH